MGRAPEANGRLILVVEDEDSIRELTVLALEGAGYEVVATVSGEEAVARLRERPADAVLAVVDFQMLGMNGRDTAAALRALRPDLPVLLVSGEPVELGASRDGGPATRFLAKPWRPAELVQVVRQMLS